MTINAQQTNNYLIFSGAAAVLGALLHIAPIFGGAFWYRFIGAPENIVRMAMRGHWYPVAVCLIAATILFICAGYAFSGAGLIRRLPLLRTGLVFISCALIIHGVAFIPAVIFWPDVMMAVYDGNGINTNLTINTIVCIVTGTSYALGTKNAWRDR